MIPTQSYALGLWRGARRRAQHVPIAPGLSREEYDAGYAEGARQREPRPAAVDRGSRGRR
ncbi:hypothetical protein [Methylobacterium sp. Gmos1]